MGIIYDGNVEEKELYKAYGLTVYGKINRYVWLIHDNKEDKCIITLRIVDNNENDILNMYFGNNCSMMETFDRTIDNFLYWIVAENPDAEQIKKQVYQSLCQSNCWFNHRITSRKFKERQQKETQRKIEEREAKKRAALDRIKEYCLKKNLIFYYDGWKVYLLKTSCDAATSIVNQAIEENNHADIEKYIQFAEKYPENRDLHIIQSGEIQEINIEH